MAKTPSPPKPKKSPKQILLTSENTIMFKGVVNSNSVAKFGDRLLKLSTEARSDTIFYLVIDSPGGSIYAGLSLISLIESITQKIHCVAIFAASMGHSILQACPGKRYISSNNGVAMIHRASGMFSGQFNNGEVESQLVFWRKLVTDMQKKNAARMKYKYSYYTSRMKNEWWCSAKECIKQRFADRLVNLRCDAKLVNKKIKLNRGYYYSGCPLIRGVLGSGSRRTFPFR